MSTPSALVLSVVLLLGNSYFVVSEFAMVSARRTKMEPRAAGSRMARTTLRAMDDLTAVIAAAQFGVTICSVGLGAVAEPGVAHLLEPLARATHLPAGWVYPVAFAVALLVVVYCHVVFGEMVPKNIALADPEAIAVLLGPPMVGLVTVLRPAVWAINAASDGVVRLMRIEPRNALSAAYTREQVEAMVDESRDEGLLQEEEYQRLSGALGFSSRPVSEVLLPLEELQTVPRGARASDVEAICASTGFSRFPVTGDIGQLIGYVHIKDLISPDPHGRARVVEDSAIRPLATVGAGDTLGAALHILQAEGAHLARLVAEDGTVLGVATLEDVLEELVGEIRDAAHAD